MLYRLQKLTLIYKQNWKIVLITIFLFISLLLGGELLKSNDRLIIYNDSIQLLKNKSNENYSRINNYIVSEKELKKINGELYDEINKLKNKPLDVAVISNKIVYKDSLHTVMVLPSKLRYEMNWDKDTIFNKDNYIRIKGSSVVQIDSSFLPIKFYSNLEMLEMKSKVYIVKTIKGNTIYFNARSDFPLLKFEDMESYTINSVPSKAKRIGLGVFAGVSFTGKPIVGVGISYNLFNF